VQLIFIIFFEKYSTLGELFDHIDDETAVTTYAHRLWDFFRGLFLVSFSTIFELFKCVAY